MKQIIKLMWMFILLIAPLKAQSDWIWQYPLPQGNNLYDVQLFGQNTIIAAGYAGTVMRSTNAGNDWQMDHHVGIDFLFTDFHFIDSNTGWAVGDSDRVLKTIDGGLVWTEYHTGDSSQYNNHETVFFINSDTGWVSGRSTDYISKTVNGGLSWMLSQSPNFGVSSIYFIDADTGWVTAGGRIYQSTDGGTTWNLQYNNFPNSVNVIYFRDSQHGWALGGTEVIVRTTDGGQNWNLVNSGNNFFTSLLDVFFWDTNHGVAVGESGIILKTSDGGASWTPRESGTKLKIYGVAFDNVQNGWAVGENGLLLNTSDGGETWSGNGSIRLSNVQFLDENIGWAFGTGALLKSVDGGDNWQVLDSTISGSVYQFFDSQTAIFIDPWNDLVFRTLDGGVNWDTLSSVGGIPPYEMFFLDVNTGWVLDAVRNIVKTTDGGVTWNYFTSGISEFINDLYFTDSNNGWMAGNLGTVFQSTDGGESWAPQYSGTSALIDIEFADNNTGWIASFSELLKTTDGGLSWTLVTGNAPQITDLTVIDANTLWALGGTPNPFTGRPYFSTDAGMTWTEETIPAFAGQDIFFFNNQEARIVTDLGGILKRSGSVTPIKDPSVQNIALDFELFQNYPNPFNPVTTIKYQIPAMGNVEVSIFNLLGQKVGTLAREVQDAGVYTVQWEGRNDSGQQVASGVYLYLITYTPLEGKMGAVSRTHKMLLVR